MSEKRLLQVAESDADQKFLRTLEEKVHHLCGMVEEMTETNPATLLSPIFREMLRNNARDVRSNISKVARMIHVDRPHKSDLEWTTGT